MDSNPRQYHAIACSLGRWREGQYTATQPRLAADIAAAAAAAADIAAAFAAAAVGRAVLEEEAEGYATLQLMQSQQRHLVAATFPSVTARWLLTLVPALPLQPHWRTAPASWAAPTRSPLCYCCPRSRPTAAVHSFQRRQLHLHAKEPVAAALVRLGAACRPLLLPTGMAAAQAQCQGAGADFRAPAAPLRVHLRHTVAVRHRSEMQNDACAGDS